MSSLNVGTGYNELVSYYEKNKDKPFNEWLSFDTIFDKPGKQGLVGLLTPKEDKKKSNIITINPIQIKDSIKPSSSRLDENTNKLKKLILDFYNLSELNINIIVQK